MDERTRRRLARERHALPEGFDRRMDARLRQVLSLRPARPRAGRLRLAVALCLLLAAGAAALTQMGVLDFRVPYMRESYYFTLPGARGLVHRLGAQARFDGWTLTLREALYDGRWLQVLYSVTDHGATRPFTEQEKQDIANGSMDAFYALLNAADAYPSTETNGTLLIDGREVLIRSVAAAGGDAPGEYLFLADSMLELAGSGWQTPEYARPEGRFTLGLPMTDRRGAQVQLAAAEVRAGDAASRYARPLPGPVPLEGADMTFIDVFASPASVVLEYAVTGLAPVPGGVTGACPDEALLPEAELTLLDAAGQPAGTLKDARDWMTQLEDGRAQRRYQRTFTPTGEGQPLRLRTPQGRVIEVPAGR